MPKARIASGIHAAGAMGASIVIRTLVLQGGKIHLQVGGAIVSDSNPEAEYEETLAKSRAAVHALDAGLLFPEPNPHAPRRKRGA